MGLAGWKWLFILEAVPTVVLGFVAFGYLTGKPEKAHWLTPPEREALALSLTAEKTQREAMRHYSLSEALCNPRVLALSAIYFGNVTCNYGLGFFMPQILQRFGIPTANVGWYVAIPYLLAMVSMVLWSRPLAASVFSDLKWDGRLPLEIGGCAIMAVAIVASYVPVRRAVRVDPGVALRHE